MAEPREVHVGDAAPDFDLPATGGGRVSLRGLRGRPVVLFFYPKDDTSGCTREACALRDGYSEYTSRRLAAVFRKVSVDGHDREVLVALSSLRTDPSGAP